MTTSVLADVTIEGDIELDVIEEIRLRTWARSNYCSAEQRDESWHPVILDEMSNRDRESRRS